MPKLSRQEELINKTDWDALIVLDSCRHDYFRRVCGDYLNGTLSKAISPGSETDEWCNKVFRDKYGDIVYISANPFINSKVPVEGFDAKKHFYKVVDVWDMGWNMRTVHPRELNRAARRWRMKYPGKKLIIHYLQPHAPYFDSNEELPRRKRPPRSFMKTFGQITAFEEFRHSLGGRIRNLFGLETVWWTRRLLGTEPNPMERVWREQGRNGVRQAYERNLRIALKYVKQLVNRLPGKIIITADHGELLGEMHDYGHRAERYVWPLLEVPWFEVES